MKSSSRVVRSVVVPFFVVAALVLNGCSETKSEPWTKQSIKSFKDNLEEKTQEELIFVCDKLGNRLDNQSVKSGEKCWVGGSFSYSGDKGDLSVYVVSMARKRRDGKFVICSMGSGRFVLDKNSDRVTFLAETEAPQKTGEFRLSINSHGKIFAESNITVVE